MRPHYAEMIGVVGLIWQARLPMVLRFWRIHTGFIDGQPVPAFSCSPQLLHMCNGFGSAAASPAVHHARRSGPLALAVFSPPHDRAVDQHGQKQRRAIVGNPGMVGGALDHHLPGHKPGFAAFQQQ